MAERLALSRAEPASRMMRLAAWMLGALAVMAAVVLVAPSTLDWSRYRGAIARFATAELGRPVHIDGRISVELLPSPLVVAAGVRLDDRGDGIALAAPALRLRLALVPLLFGHLVPRELVLIRPAISLPWPLPPAALASDRPAWLGASSARIEGGTLAVGNLKLTDLDAGLASGGVDAGGFVVTGTATSFGQKWRFTNRLGVADSLGALPVEISLDAAVARADAPSDTGGQFIGTLAQDGALTGRVTAHAGDLSRLLPAPPVAARAEGTVSLGRPARGEGGGQTELALTIGGVPITATLRPAPDAGTRILSLSTGRLDLDGWASALSRLRSGGSTAQMIDLPWPVSLDFTADAVQLHGGLVRGVHLALDIDGAHAMLHDVAAVLPGEAQLGLSGTLVEDVQGLHLSGEASLDAPQLRTTLGWLGGMGLQIGGDMPPLVLRTAHLAGHVEARRDRVDVTRLAGTIEQMQVAGSAGVDTASGAVNADISVDRLGLDNWAPDLSALHWGTISRALGGFDLALKLHAKTATLRGVDVDGLALDAATSAGGFAVNALVFMLDGLHGTLSGTLAADGEMSDGRFDLTANQATALAHYLTQHVKWLHFTDYLWSGPVHLHAEANGPREALVTSLGVDLADARLEAHPVLNLASGTWTAQMTLRHPGAPRLLGALGVAKAEDWLGEGSLSMLAQLSGGPGQIRFDSFDITAGLLHASGDLALARGAQEVAAGHIVADTLPLPMFAPHEAAPIPLGILQGWAAKFAVSAADVTVGDTDLAQDASADLSLSGGVLTLANVKAALGGGALTGTVTLDSAATPPRLTVTAKIAGAKVQDGLFGTPIDVASGQFDGDLALAAQGYSPAALTASLSGTVHLVGSAGSVAGLDLAAAHQAIAAAKAVTPALSDGVTPFDHLDIGGSVSLGSMAVDHLALTGPAGAAQATGTLDFAGGTLNLLAHLPDQLDLRLSGPFPAPRRLVEPGPVALAP